MTNAALEDAAVLAIERPDKALWAYYVLRLLLVPPLLPVLIIYYYFRYHTMRYRFTDEGISMKWGILFRREIILNYARIQDIHLQSNLIERWLGLARVLVQTASGSAGAEMTIEGLKQFEAVRDFLYSKMRGVKDVVRRPGVTSPASDPGSHDLAQLLRQISAEVRGAREALESRQIPPSSPG
jgi:putative membrane protein